MRSLQQLLLLLLLLLPCSRCNGQMTDCQASVNENTGAGATIADLHSICFSGAGSRDLTMVGQSKGDAVPQDVLDRMLMIDDDGKLRVKGSIDREDPQLKCKNNANCKKIITIMRNNYQETKRLLLWIEDVNDNAPKFSKENLVHEVPENMNAWLLPLPKITDPDEGRNGHTRARILRSSVKKLSGKPVREMLQDAGQVVSITDAYTPGVTVLRAEVHDADSCHPKMRLAAADCARSAKFRMRLGQRVPLFAVNSTTGDVVVMNALAPGLHSLNLSVSDSGQPGPLTSSVAFTVRVEASTPKLFFGQAWSSSANWTVLIVIIIASSFITIVLVVAIVLLNRRQPCLASDSDASLTGGKARSSSSINNSLYGNEQIGLRGPGTRTFGHHANYVEAFMHNGNGMGLQPQMLGPSYAAGGSLMHAAAGAQAAAPPPPGLPVLGDYDVASADSGHGASEEEIQELRAAHSMEQAKLLSAGSSSGRSPGLSVAYSACGTVRCGQPSISEAELQQLHQQQGSSTFCRQQQQQQQLPPALHMMTAPNFDSACQRTLSRPPLAPITGSRAATPQLQQQQQQAAADRPSTRV